MICHKDIASLLERVEIDKSTVICHFKCPESDVSIASSVAFEPYDGAIELSWQDILFHPIESYNRYYHTPIVIYGDNCDKTIVLKAFKQIANNFRWSDEKQRYICK